MKAHQNNYQENIYRKKKVQGKLCYNSGKVTETTRSGSITLHFPWILLSISKSLESS